MAVVPLRKKLHGAGYSDAVNLDTLILLIDRNGHKDELQAASESGKNGTLTVMGHTFLK